MIALSCKAVNVAEEVWGVAVVVEAARVVIAGEVEVRVVGAEIDVSISTAVETEAVVGIGI